MNLLFLILIIIIPLIAQGYVSSTYNKYSKIKNKNKINGYDIARKILNSEKLSDMYIVETTGTLTDHYDPRRKIIRLSKSIYNNSTIASVAVAAHECGHALQDKEGYSFFKIRTFLFPIIKITSSIAYITIFIGFLFEILDLAYIGFAMVLLGIIFQGLNLPLEFNASSRAKKELKQLKIFNKEEIDEADKMLKAAAFTYVAGMFASILELLRLVLLFNNND